MLKEFRKPDLNAPRCRQESHNLITTEFIKEFRLKHPQYKDLTGGDIAKIIKVFHNKLWDHVLHNRDGVELPENIGYVFIGTCAPPKKFVYDISKSLKNNFRTRHNNFESDSYLAKIFYTNFATKYKFKNRKMWTFEASRNFKRAVSKIYPTNWKMYVQVEKEKNISRYLKKTGKDNYFKRMEKNYIVSDSYNEFDLN
jgi:hypothetical protein